MKTTAKNKISNNTLLVWGLVLVYAIPFNAQSQKTVTGWIELVNIGIPRLPMLAKIDTGADHSSINVVNPEIYYKRREQWVKFKVTNADGRTITMNKKIVRYARIKKKTAMYSVGSLLI